jgi:hypothetical protein
VLEVQGGFKWPHFVLSAAILSEVGLCHQDEQEVKFRLYNTTIHTWTTVRIGHVITLRDGDHIFLKRANVIHCLNFDDLLSGSQGRKPHFSKNLPHDRTYVRQALKVKKTQIEKIIEIPSSEEEVEKDEHRSQASQQTSTRRQTSMRPLLIPQRFKVEPSDFAIPLTTIDTLPQRTALHPPHVVKVEPTVIDLTISDSESDAQPVTMTRKRARSSNSLSPSPSTPSSSPRSSTDDAYDTDDHLPAWPSAFYVVDVVRGFEKCEAAACSRKSVKEAFTKCFCIPFRHSTFYVHRRH